jgi:endonuclease V-like protein UPF0215 family
MRHRPDLPSIKRALLERVRGGRRKWELIKKAGEIENACGLYIQLAGIDLPAAAKLIKKLSIHSRVHEPLRSSHLIAGGVVLGHSTGMV